MKGVAKAAVSAVLVFSAASVLAWTGPTASPPNNNVSAPINVGSTAQTKSGYLGLNGASASYPLTITGPSANWTEVINWPPSSAPGYGILVGTSASGYSQFQNASGYWTQLADGGYGLITNGDVCINGGKCLNGTTAGGGMWEDYSNGVCMVGNAFTGGCSCPGYAPNARFAALGNSGNGSWAFYLYYCT